MRVAMYAVVSVDGRLTRGEEAGDAFASAADRRFFRAALRACDACVMGRATYEHSRERLRPEVWPELRRVILTRRPEAWAAETRPGVVEFTAEGPAETLRRLRADGRRRCALLGGGQTYAAWLAAGLVDEVWLTVEPRLFGAGTPLLAGTGLVDARLRLLRAEVLAEGGPLLTGYEVVREASGGRETAEDGAP